MEETNKIETSGENPSGLASKRRAPKRGSSKRLVKFLIILACILAGLSIFWVAFSMIGRVNASALIPDTAAFHVIYGRTQELPSDDMLRVSVSNPLRLLENVLSHEVSVLGGQLAIPEIAQAASALKTLKTSPLFRNNLVRFAARGNIEFAMFFSGAESRFAAAWDSRLFSPLLRVLPALTAFLDIPNLYFVQSGRNSRFEFRTGDMTLFIGAYRNLLFITDSQQLFEERSADNAPNAFSVIKSSDYDAAFLVSGDFIRSVLGGQDPGIEEILQTIEFDSLVEAGFSIYPKRINFRFAAPVSSNQPSLSRLLEQRSGIPVLAERIPADAQYATILSAGTLRELYQAAIVFSPELSDTLRSADSSARFLLRLSIDDLLFSWTGNEFAVFGLEGRPHPVYAIQISNERRRQEVFDQAFRSIVLREDVRLNLDGMRIPRIEVPDFLQTLLRQWNIFLPSPFYIVYRDFLLVSESADTLLAALRAMQRNNVLPRTPAWREIAGGRTIASAFSIYYSMDRSIPFFLRGNTVLSGFLSLYRQGLIRMSFDRGQIDFSLALVPGSGSGVTLVAGFPRSITIDDREMPSNRVHGAGFGGAAENSRVFYSSAGSAFSLNVADNTVYELPGQGSHWIIPAVGVGGRDEANAWVVTAQGRVTLVSGSMEPAVRFPILTGLRLSSVPQAYNGRLYLSCEDGKVLVIDEHAAQTFWETSFDAALRSPPNFLSVVSGREAGTFAAVYPKSFFGEIWLLNENGRAFPNWPVPIAVHEDGTPDDFGIGFGTPVLFAHNRNILMAFVNQAGQLLVYNTSGGFVQPFPINLDGVFFQQPVYDGEFLWLISSNGTLFRIDFHGEVLYHQIPNFSVMEEGFITLFDSDGDNIPEIFITGEGNALHGFTRNFRSLEGFPLPVWGRPLFVPAQNNRRAEIFGIGMSRRLYRWQFR